MVWEGLDLIFLFFPGTNQEVGKRDGRLLCEDCGMRFHACLERPLCSYHVSKTGRVVESCFTLHLGSPQL